VLAYQGLTNYECIVPSDSLFPEHVPLEYNANLDENLCNVQPSNCVSSNQCMDASCNSSLDLDSSPQAVQSSLDSLLQEQDMLKISLFAS
jgi:hypothetical protein